MRPRLFHGFGLLKGWQGAVELNGGADAGEGVPVLQSHGIESSFVDTSS